MSKRFYAVQVADDFTNDYGSTIKRDAIRMARREAKENPSKEIRIVYCRVDDDFAENIEIIQEGDIN